MDFGQGPGAQTQISGFLFLTEEIQFCVPPVEFLRALGSLV